MHSPTLSTLSPNQFKANHTSFFRYEDVEGNTLKGIELTLFSFQVALQDYEDLLHQVCDTHFQYQINSISDAGSMTVYISPKEYCLVAGGMMYKSAGSIISELVKNGLLIKGMRTVED